MFLCGIGPDLSAVEVAEYGPSAIATSCGGEIFPSRIYLGVADVVIHKHSLTL
jgi:hypothetical protein